MNTTSINLPMHRDLNINLGPPLFDWFVLSLRYLTAALKTLTVKPSVTRCEERKRDHTSLYFNGRLHPRDTNNMSLIFQCYSWLNFIIWASNKKIATYSELDISIPWCEEMMPTFFLLYQKCLRFDSSSSCRVRAFIKKYHNVLSCVLAPYMMPTYATTYQPSLSYVCLSYA